MEKTTPRVPGYTLNGKLGEGGMGTVWKATQASTGQVVALKILHPALAQNRTYVERFLREIRTALTLDHPAIVKGLEAGEAHGTFFYAMEYVEGEPLIQTIRRQGKLDEVWALEVIAQILHGVDYAWKSGFVHRDIKPQNILVNREGEAKLTDLGLAKYQEDASLTQTGLTLGTPHYIAPERARGDKSQDIRVDLYSIGATLYHMLTGETLYAGGTSAEILARQVTEPMPDPRRRRPDINPWVVDILSRALEKDPARRYADPAMMLEDIEGLLDGREPIHVGTPRSSSRVSRAPAVVLPASRSTLKLALGVIVALVVVGAFILMTSFPSSSGPAHRLPTVREEPPPRPAPAIPDTPTAPEKSPLEKVADLEKEGKLDQAYAELNRNAAAISASEYQKSRESLQKRMAERDSPEIDRLALGEDLDRALSLLKERLTAAGDNRFLADRIEEKISAVEAEKVRRARGGIKNSSEDEAILVAARDKLDNNRPSEAVEDLKKLLFRSPDNREAQKLLARALFKNQQLEPALQQLDPLIAADPRNLELLKLRIDISQALKKPDEIARSITLWLAASPPTVALLLQRAEACSARPEEALKDIEQALALDAKSIDAWKLKAALLTQTRQFAPAVAALSELLKIDPKDKQAYFDRGQLHLLNNELESAEADFKQALALDSSFAAARAKLKEAEERAKNPVRPASRANAALLFDGKSKNGWVPNTILRVEVRDSNLAIRSSDKEEPRLLVNELEFDEEYTVYAMLKAPLNFRGKDKDEVHQYVGVALGYRRLGSYTVVHFSGNHLMIEKVKTTDKTLERSFVAASTVACPDLSRWVEIEIAVRKDTIRVKSGDLELLAETRIPDADLRGPIALVFRTGAEIQFRWIDVVSAKAAQPRPGIFYDPKSNAWTRSGKLENVEGGVVAAPDGACWATTQAPGPAYEIETVLSAGTSGPGYALIFFEAFDRHCAFSIGLNEKSQEKMSVGLFGDFKGRFIYFSNNEHFITKPGNLSFKKKNKYKIVVLPTTVEVLVNNERVFIENKDAFVQKIDYAKGIADKNGVRAREMQVGLGAWDISGKDSRSIRAQFDEFTIRPIK